MLLEAVDKAEQGEHILVRNRHPAVVTERVRQTDYKESVKDERVGVGMLS